MINNQNSDIVKKFLQSFSIETTPNVYKKYGQFSDFLHKKNSIYITYLPDDNSKNVIETAKKLSLEGFNVIPHLPARTIRDNVDLEKYIGELSEVCGCSSILVIGGGGAQRGSISSTIEVLESDLLSKYNFKSVGVAGHPEGNPDIKQKDLDNAIIQKNEFALKVDYNIYLATQFFFEATSLIEWEKHLESLDNKLEIHAGIPGPASIKTLISYAKSCGIGNSLRFISKQAFNITKLANTKTPDKLIYDLANYKNNNLNSKLKKLHFYAFGGIKKTSEWLDSVKDSDISYENEKFIVK
mgnify:CR=1 FL=1